MDSDPLRLTRRLALSGWAILSGAGVIATLAVVVGRRNDNVALGVLAAGTLVAGMSLGGAALLAASGVLR